MSNSGMYELISRNKRNSILLILCMCLLIAVVAGFFGAYYGNITTAIIFAALGMILAGISAIVSYYSGTKIIMTVSNARKINIENDYQLDNIVEEMCIASGLPKPEIYIIEDSAPNAFATGRSPEHSAIAVTRGLIQKLNRNELQGVIAHEMSHIGNFDIRFAMLMSVLVGTLLLMCDMFWRISLFGGGRRRRSSNSSGGKGQAIIAIVALILMIVAPVLAYVIQMASSRQREYLADATGAKMTRNPDALASALEKIASDTEPLEAANRGTQQLYIVNPLKGKAYAAKQSLFATHPPTQERIERLRAMT